MQIEKVNKNILKKNLICALIFLIGTSIIQCAPKPQTVKEDEEVILKRRAQEYWSYKIKGEWDKSYLYELPDYREKINVVKYVQQNGRSLVRWEGFDIVEAWTNGEEGVIKLSIKYRYLIPMTQKAAYARVSEEKWIKKEGQWYRLSPL